ncbi:MAG: glycosyltransferase [Bacteroidetes bacterium]|nr:glycosyltransferase [Bacteroidota bacterium]
MGLKISFYGSSLVSSFWNGAATYYRGIIKALYNNGHSITFYEPDAYSRQQYRDIEEPEWANVVVYKPEKDALLDALEQGSDADIIIKASGVGVFDTELERAVIEIRKPNQTIIFWDVDAPATLERINNNPNDPFIKLIPQYDLILTYGGGNAVVKEYKKFGAKNCTPIYNAVDPETHHPVMPDEKYNCDLAFLGNRLPDREARVDEFFLTAVNLLPDKSFILGGNGWNDKPIPENVDYVGHVSTNHHNAFNSTPLVVLNICRESMAKYGFSPATRVFEAAGAGSCIITDIWKGIDTFFEPGKEILLAGSGEEVASILDAITPTEAKRIGHEAYKKVIQKHTYKQRAIEFEQVLNYKKIFAI